MRMWTSEHATTTQAGSTVASPRTLTATDDILYQDTSNGARDGVQTGHERVYLVFWGSQWGTAATDSHGNITLSGDPEGVAPYLQSMFKGIGTNGEQWSSTLQQYCSATLYESATCPGFSTHISYSGGGVLAGVWADESAPAPTSASHDGIGAEATLAATHFGNTTFASNQDTQYVVVSPTGTDPDGYEENNFCAWHDAVFTGTAGWVAYTNLPYLPDVGASCGQRFINTPGTLDGMSIVGGHEYAETVTDVNGYGWWDSNASSAVEGNEIADNCAWVAPAGNVSFATGSFPMQSLWSNSHAACELTTPITKVGSATKVASSGSPSIASAPITYTATVTGTDGGGGSVSFADDGTVIAGCSSQPLDSSGHSTCVESPAAVAAHSIAATYLGDPGTTGSTSPSITQVVQGTTSTFVGSSGTPALVGSPVTYSVLVEGSDAGGSVAYSDDGSTIAGCAAQPLTAIPFTDPPLAAATCVDSSPPAGAHSIDAQYSGDSLFVGSSASPISQVIQTLSSVSVGSSKSPSTFGSSVLYTATVTDSDGGGSVAFSEDGSPLSGCSSQPLDGADQATCADASSTAGSHSIVATYSGDTLTVGSTSSPLVQVVRLKTSVSVSTSASPAPFGTSVTYTATVTGSDAGGAVAFTEDGAPLSGCSSEPLSGAHHATCTEAASMVGAHSIVATYSGDAGSADSTSPSLSQVVTKAAILISASATPSKTRHGHRVMLAVQGLRASASGTVRFTSGGHLLCEADVSQGSAQCRTSKHLRTGTYKVTATYSGDSNYASSKAHTKFKLT